jgi:hypothetical protein
MLLAEQNSSRATWLYLQIIFAPESSYVAPNGTCSAMSPSYSPRSGATKGRSKSN